MKTDEAVATPAISPLSPLRMIGGTGTSVVCAADDGVCTVSQPDPE